MSALDRAKKTLKEIEPKPCKKHGKDLANGCDDCLRYGGEFLAHSYLDLNIDIHERMCAGIEALKDPELAEQLRELDRKKAKGRRSKR